MKRKEFLKVSSLAAFSLSTIGCAIASENEGEFKGDCETTNDILGPFYRKDAPTRQDMTYKGLVGNKIKVVGTVFGDDCITPLENVKVEIWHCNTKGEYDNKSEAFLHRASWETDKDGKYSFNTIMPGKYLNGRLYRPAHIHFRVTADGYKELISQVYFKGDPHITEDPWASAKKAELRILEVYPETIQSDLAVKFDIYLTKV